ncbi:MAG: FAD/NAD(P)-binding protein [Armatimonadota bacterium]|nr:FAD/NAD(P)-binding protein [Armatimonadota bacterium]
MSSSQISSVTDIKQNPYKPFLATVEQIIEETWDTKTFRAVFHDEELREKFTYEPGQFQEVSVFGAGEATFCLTSTPTRPGGIEFSVKRVGSLTDALHEISEGAVVGIRGPFGNWFPYKEWVSSSSSGHPTPNTQHPTPGKDLLFIGGGIGMAPLRSLLNFCLDNRGDYGKIDVIYGARTSGDLCYKTEFDAWRANSNLYLTIDKEEQGWEHNVGFVPSYLNDLAPKPANTIAITCGPPIMIKFVLQNLATLGFVDEQIYTTLEMKMKCGVGKCGRCNIGHKFVCLDGPVFSYAEIKGLPPEF